MSSNHTAAAWREAAANVKYATQGLVLPSGMIVQARNPDLQTWLAHGKVPDAFQAMILARAENTADQARQLTVEDIMEMGAFTRAIVCAAVVEPRIALGAPGPGEISYLDVPAEDIAFIFAWALRPPEVAELAAFRRGGDVPAVGDDGGKVRPAAERNGGTRRRRRGAGL